MAIASACASSAIGPATLDCRPPPCLTRLWRPADLSQESKLHANKSLAVSVGEALKQKAKQFKNITALLHQIMKEWDPNRDGVIRFT